VAADFVTIVSSLIRQDEISTYVLLTGVGENQGEPGDD
jgi:hypothetical protein